MKRKGKIKIDAAWSSVSEQKGRIEIICNGKLAASIEGNAGPDATIASQDQSYAF
jgi:hypothetical protein